MRTQHFVCTLGLVIGLLAGTTPAMAKLKEGAAFPKGVVPTLDGKGKVDISSMKGKVVIVDFWASWCEPCKIELPALNEMYKKYKSKGLVVVGVNMDEKKADALAFLKEHPVQVQLAYDGEKKVLAEQIEIDKMPTSFIVDKHGKVAVRHEAFRDGDAAKIEEEIKKLLAGK
jgi:cytochrome c biogenesis protein CcmG/thiol:disulfide interchange protein DsbE